MKILLPIDGSDCARQTVEWASEFYGKTHEKSAIEFYLLHVVELIPEIPVSDYELEESIKMLQETRSLLESKGFKVAGTHYVIERPARAICLYADEQNVDQIVMGSHGRQGLAKFLMGSVSEEVFKQAKQSVFIYNNGPKPSLTVSQVDHVHMAEVS
jgi:nucleotide-binding universal stress UspA family protein